MKANLTTLALGTLLMLSPAFAGSGKNWGEDFDAAAALAKKEGRDLLVDFTGSHWCGW